MQNAHHQRRVLRASCTPVWSSAAAGRPDGASFCCCSVRVYPPVEILEEYAHLLPVLTCPYIEPTRHWQTVDGETHDVMVGQCRAANEPSQMGAQPACQRDPSSNATEPAAGTRRAGLRPAKQPARCSSTGPDSPEEGPVYSLSNAQREALKAWFGWTSQSFPASQSGEGAVPVAAAGSGVMNWGRLAPARGKSPAHRSLSTIAARLRNMTNGRP